MTSQDTKDCPKCSFEKPLFSFYKDATKKDGLTSYCKTCSKNKRKVKYKENTEAEKAKLKKYYNNNKDKAKNYYLTKNYGIDVEVYEQMFKEQEGKCAICGAAHEDLNRGLFVDHCHSSGKVRGLLCQFCNTLLGMAQDKLEILQKASNYLTK